MSYILYIIILTLIFAPIYLIWAIYRINKKMRRIEWLKSQDFSVLRIDVPRNNDKSPLAAEQMFAAIHGIFSESAEFQSHVSFEIVAKDKFIQFYVYVPSHLKDFVEGQIYAQYPTVEINEVDDYIASIDMAGKQFAVSELKLNKPDVYPIKQFTDFEVDPISGVTAVMAKLNEGDEVWFQMIIRPVGDEWQEHGHTMVHSVRGGAKPNRRGIRGSIGKALMNAFKALLLQAFRPGADMLDSKEVKLPASVEEALKSIEQKITKLGFETKIRIMSIGSDSISARLRNQNVTAAFKQYNTTNLNGFRAEEPRIGRTEEFKDFSERSFEGRGNIFNIAELASIYHLPHMSVSTPSIVWSGSKKGEPPANLPMAENTPAEDLTIIGESNFRNVFKKFGIKRDDRRRHIYIVGKSGVGKSVLIENMAFDDVMKGRGVIIVDPHGELSDKIRDCIPDHRINDVVVFDPSDREFPVAFNLLEAVDEDFKPIVASGFVGIFKKLFDKSWGPRLEHILRNTIFALLDYPESTMLDIPRMLTNNRFRDKVVEKVKDPIIREFWLNEFASFDSKFRTEAVSPILNKVGQFLSSSTIRNIVGQPKSTINIREIMDQEKIMIVNLSRGKIGEDNSALLGAMMITKIQLAAMSRADVTVDQRPDTYLYVDEFQNFATDSFAVILAEARKYNLNLTMAHQYIAQLKDEVREAVFGNAGTLISFRVGGADADVLVKEFEPVFTNNDLVNLDKFHIYTKLLIDGISCPAFSARTLPPISKLSGNIDKVVQYSRQKYSNSRGFVEDLISNRSRQEELELLAEAEAFKKGGLEALLVKKDISSYGPSPKSDLPPSSPPQASIINPSPVLPQRVDTQSISPDPVQPAMPVQASVALPSVPDEDQPVEEKEKKSSKYLRTENILDGRIYKERTARGGVKWYIGEEVDEAKLADKGTIIDDEARKMIELTAKNAKPGSKAGRNDNSASEKAEQKNVESGGVADSNRGGNILKNNDEIKIPDSIRPSEEVAMIDKTEKKSEKEDRVSFEEPSTELVQTTNLPAVLEEHLPVAAVIDPPSVLEEKTPAVTDKREVEQKDTQTGNSSVSVVSTVMDTPVHLEEGKAIKLGDDD